MRKTTPGVQLGRPPKPVISWRNKRLVTFLTEDDYNRLTSLARESGVSLSSLCNDIITTALHSKHLVIKSTD